MSDNKMLDNSIGFFGDFDKDLKNQIEFKPKTNIEEKL